MRKQKFPSPPSGNGKKKKVILLVILSTVKSRSLKFPIQYNVYHKRVYYQPTIEVTNPLANSGH